MAINNNLKITQTVEHLIRPQPEVVLFSNNKKRDMVKDQQGQQMDTCATH